MNLQEIRDRAEAPRERGEAQTGSEVLMTKAEYGYLLDLIEFGEPPKESR